MGRTITFSEKNKGWTSFWKWETKLMAKLNNRFYGFKDGQLWLFNDETSDKRNSFFDEQFSSKVKTTINTESSEDKIFKNLIQEGNQPWEATLETNLTNGTIKASEFNKRESKWYSHTRGNEDVNSMHGGATQGIGVIQSIAANVITYNNVSEFVNIGDELYQLNGGENELIGVVEAKTSTTLTFSTVLDSFAPVNGLYSFSKKNARVEGSELRGYYMDVELENDSTSKAELFAIQSNIVKSYV